MHLNYARRDERHSDALARNGDAAGTAVLGRQVDRPRRRADGHRPLHGDGEG